MKIINNRLTAVDPNHQPDDLGAECDRAVPEGQRTRGLMEDCWTLLEMQYTLAGNINDAAAVFHWTGYTPISEWRGIAVEDGRVRALEYVTGISRGGTIPPQIAELTELRTLYISHNELDGEIPRELANLANLNTLLLYDNRLEGLIPPELGDMPSLNYADLTENPLTGCVSTERFGSDFRADLPPCE